MGVRTAREAEGFRSVVLKAWLVAAIVGATLLVPAGRPAAQPVAPAAAIPTPDLPPVPDIKLSRDCEVPGVDIATPTPLPHLQEILRDRRAIRVLAIGSSSTVGMGASSPSHNYPSQLESILEGIFKGVDVVTINRGVSGEVASGTADRIKALVGLERPDLVLWQVGTNDALMGVPAGEFKATVGDTLHWLRDRGVDTVLVGLQYTLKVSKDQHYGAIRAALRDVAQEAGVLLVRRYEAMEFIDKAKAGALLSPDELHLNDLGYRCMAEHIARAVVVSAFLKPKSAKKS